MRHPFEADAALLLCSDGLTDLVPSAAIAADRPRLCGHPREVVRALIEAANDAGGKDNVTAVYVEGPRFATAEDTRDLRALRAARLSPSSALPRRRRPDRADRAADARNRRGAGASAALVLLLLRSPRWLCICNAIVCGADVTGDGVMAATTPLVVRPGESIDRRACAAHAAGAEVIVEPGEYRERLG